MTWKSRLMAFFPTSVFLLTVWAVIEFAQHPSPGSFLWILAALYAYPLLLFHLHNIFFPLKEGKQLLDLDQYSSWWGGHQIQLVYIAFPWLEALLRLIPGAFSLWLRMWGSRVGKGVYWTPLVEIDDRSLVNIGDNVVFGHKVEVLSHVVGPKKGGLSLYSQTVKIGNNAFIGAGSRLAPGAHIDDEAFLPVLTDVYIDEFISKDDKLKKPTANRRSEEKKES